MTIYGEMISLQNEIQSANIQKSRENAGGGAMQKAGWPQGKNPT
jgi:hypothetical protein